MFRFGASFVVGRSWGVLSAIVWRLRAFPSELIITECNSHVSLNSQIIYGIYYENHAVFTLTSLMSLALRWKRFDFILLICASNELSLFRHKARISASNQNVNHSPFESNRILKNHFDKTKVNHTFGGDNPLVIAGIQCSGDVVYR